MLDIQLRDDPEIPLLVIYSRDIKTCSYRNSVWIALCIFIIAQEQETPLSMSISWRVDNVLSPYDASAWRTVTDTCYHIDEPWKHCSKKKPYHRMLHIMIFLLWNDRLWQIIGKKSRGCMVLTEEIGRVGNDG